MKLEDCEPQLDAGVVALAARQVTTDHLGKNDVPLEDD